MPILTWRLASESRLEAFEGGDQIIDPRRPLGYEAFSELDADQEPEVTGAGLDYFEEGLLREQSLRLARTRIVKLAPVGEDGGPALLDRRRDVHDEVGLVEVGPREVEGLLGTVSCVRGLDLAQSRVVGGVRHEMARPDVVGVPVFGVRRQDEPRLLASDEIDEQELLLAPRREAAVPEVQRLAQRRSEDLGRALGLLSALSGVTAGSHLPARQVHDSKTPAPGGESGERARAAELDVVGVRGDGQHVNRHARFPFPPAGRLPRERFPLRGSSRWPPGEWPSGPPDRRPAAARAADRAVRPASLP